MELEAAVVSSSCQALATEEFLFLVFHVSVVSSRATCGVA